MKFSLAATAAVVLCASSHAGVIYQTDFDNYISSALSGQTAWIGTGGSWAVSGSVNAGQTSNLVTSNPAGTGKSVRITTEKYLSSGRTKAYLDLLNSGKWASASAGGNNILSTSLDVYVQSLNPLACSFGILNWQSSSQASSGLMIDYTGKVWYAIDGYSQTALFNNRTNTSTTVSLNAWHNLRLDMNVTTGACVGYVDGVQVASFSSTKTGSVFASMIMSTTDAPSGTTTALNGYGFADNFSVSAVPTPGAAALVGLAGLMARRRRA